MKCYRTIYLIFCLSFFISIEMMGQNAAPLSTVTMDMRNVPIEQIFREMEKQTALFFSYESSLLKDLPKMNFQATDESFSYCLKRLFEKLPLTYRITGQYVIVKRKPQQYTISGFIRDSVTFESLIHATLLDKKSGKGVVSNNYGFYSITLPAGEVVLSSSYVGYGVVEICFQLEKDTLLEISLIPVSSLDEIVVQGGHPHSPILSSRMGNIQLAAPAFYKNPALFSEPDPLRTLHLTPGIAFGTEGFSGMYVRGGGGDENLFLIDGIPIYGVNHVAGIFSTFNPDVIKHVDFYKGGFPARYGGRLSSVMDVRLKEGDMKEYHGCLSMGLISAKAHIEGPLIRDKTSFNVAFRRTWLDAITTPAFALANRNTDSDVFAGYSFYDLNAKVTHVFNPRSRMYANFYMGQDRLRYEDIYQDGEYGNQMKWRWGNLISALNWTYVFNNKLFGNLTIAYTRYKSKMSDWESYSYFDYGYYVNNSSEGYGNTSSVNERYYSYTTDEKRQSGIENVGFKYDFEYTPRTNHLIRFGADYFFHSYCPDHYKQVLYNNVQNESKDYTYIEDNLFAHETSFYVEDDWLINDQWRINAGLRTGIYAIQNHVDFSFEPRFSVRYLLKKDFSLKGSYVKMSQSLHQLSHTYVELPSAIWVPATVKLKPMESHLFSTGIYYDRIKQWNLSMELYYKKMNCIAEYKDYAGLFPDYVNWEERVAVGSGRSYGMEWMIRKPEGRTTGWVSYTLAWSDRLFKDKGINGGERFPDRYDNRHKLNMTMNHRFNKKWDMSLAWIFASGNRASVATRNYLSPQLDGDYAYVDFPVEPIYSRNVIKMRNYHRLDVGFNYYRPRKKGRLGIWNISFYNLYSRMNSFFVKSTELKENGKIGVKEKGIIPIIPSFSYTYKF